MSANDLRMAGLAPDAVAALQATARAIRDGRLDEAERLLAGLRTRFPRHAEVLRVGAILRLRQQRAGEATAMLRGAISAHPDDALLHSDLGNASIANGDRDGAFASWRRACTLAPDQPMPWFNLGRNLQLAGDSEAALDALQHCRALAPEFLPAHILAGDALLHLGRFDEAAASYRSALRFHPACGDAWRGLANIKSQPLSAGDCAALRTHLARGDIGEEDRIAMAYALGAGEEALGHYGEAFSALGDANARLRKRAPWSRAAFEGFVDAMLAATASLPAARDPDLGREAIFIVGLPRSGSTLFEQILAAHPEVEGASELPDLGDVVQAESKRRGKPFPQWVADANADDWERMGRDYLQRTARWRSSKPRFTDKMPENWKLAGVLRAMLPGATVLETRRDPLETAWSCYRQPFYQLPHFSCDFDDIAACLRGSERAMDAIRARDPARVRLLSYEDLIADPETRVRELLSACGLAFDPACLDFHRAGRSVRTASAAQVRQPLRGDTARAARYGTRLDPLRVALGLPPT
ncbi:tetratricopeptide repeat protein [Pseudoluteimonas lycopersici]|uniref:Tetratricopeptide repeat protein n=1 Tax=Pseudoluteimonas lycopersici TaxID=1324796 RepID=A0A516V817_9GAMM|nr:sulfotransferase [Lysobacter lycopersici]QDQ74660.1 tetratricopeptide repeat protein [Lysobacter lycopersici]